MIDETTPPMPVRRLHNYAYCPRLFYLQWVEALFQENADIAVGDHLHRNVDVPTTWRENLGFGPGVRWRSVELESHRLGMRGVIDLVEGTPDGVEIVEYKKGRPWRDEAGKDVVRSYDAVQVVAYALLLAEEGMRPVRARVYYAESKRHVEVSLDEEALDRCRALLAEARAVAESGRCPEPPESSARCLRCGAYPICLPGESRFWAEGVVPEGLAKVPPRPEGTQGEILVAQDPRARVCLSASRISVELEGKSVAKLPLEQLRRVYLYGAVQVTAQAMHALLERSIPVGYFSPAGRFLGVAHVSLQNQGTT